MTVAELHAIDAYLDRWCRRTASVERVGPFDVFVEPPPFWPKYSRPVTGEAVAAADVAAVVERRRELGLPMEIEHIDALHPGLAELLETLGWTLLRAPLLVLDELAPLRPLGPDVVLRFVDHDDPDLALIDSIGHVAFSSPGMAISEVGVVELEERAATHAAAATRERLRRGDSTLVAALVDGRPVSSGMLLADDATSATEIAGIGTLPAYRRRGLALAVTAALATDARARGIALVWLSAADAAVAALYARVGFREVGTYVIASLTE